MSRFARILTGGVAAAVAMTTVLACTAPADAAMHRRHYRKTVRLIPAHPRPGYVAVTTPGLVDPAIGVVPSGVEFYGNPGPTYAAAPAYAAGPAYAGGPGYGYGNGGGLLGGGGFLGTGVLPQTGILTGVPVLGGFGF